MPETEIKVVISGDASGAVRATDQASAATGRFATAATDHLGSAGNAFVNLNQFAATALGTLAGNLMTQATNAIENFTRKGIQGFGDLEQAVANISTIKPEINNAAVFASLNELQTRVPQTAKELGDSLYDVFSSVNVSQKEGIKLVEDFAKGATGAGTDAKTFGTAVMGVMNAYKLSAKDATHISDEFFNAVAAGVVTGPELASSLGPVTQAARSAGQSTEFLFAAIAAVTKEGGPAAQNINNLNNLLQKFTTDKAQAAMNDLGVKTVDAQGKFRPMQEVLTDLNKKLDPLPESIKAAKLNEIFPDAQARQGAQTLLSQLDTLKSQLETNATAVGVTQTAYEKMSNTMQSQSKLIENTFQAVSTTLAAEVLPSIVAVVKPLAKDLPGAITTAKAAFAQFKANAAEAFAPFKPLVNDIIVWFKANFPEIQKATQTVLRTVAEFWRDHGADIVAVLRPLFAAILNTVKLVAQLINGDWKGAFKTAGDVIKNMVDFSKAQFEAFIRLIGDIGNRALVAAKGIGTAIWQGITGGMGAGKSEVATAAGNLAQTATDAAKSKLDSHSPSRVFHQIGLDAGQGFVNGLLAMTAVVTANILQMLKGVEEARAKAKEMIHDSERDLVVQKYGEGSAAVIKFDNPALPQKDAINTAAAIAKNKELFTRRDNYKKNIQSALDEGAAAEADQAQFIANSLFTFSENYAKAQAAGAKSAADSLTKMMGVAQASSAAIGADLAATATAVGGQINNRNAGKDAKKSAAQETMDTLLQEAGRHGKQFLTVLLGGTGQSRQAALRGLMGDLQQSAISTLTDVLSKAFRPNMQAMVAEIGSSLKNVMAQVGSSIYSILSASYALLAASGARGKKQQKGSIFGALAAIAAAPFTGGASLAYIPLAANVGSFLADPGLDTGLALATSAAGMYGSGGSGSSAITYDGQKAMQNGKQINTFGRAVNVNIYGGVNNAADVNSLTNAITDATQTALRTGG